MREWVILLRWNGGCRETTGRNFTEKVAPEVNLVVVRTGFYCNFLLVSFFFFFLLLLSFEATLETSKYQRQQLLTLP